MARLFKGAKRGPHRPRITNGVVSTGQTVEWTPTDPTGSRLTGKQILHTLDVWSGYGDDRVAYQLHLTDDEMLSVTSDWLSRFNQQRKADAKS